METHPFPPVSDAVRAAGWGMVVAAAATLVTVAGLLWLLRRQVPRPWYAAPAAWVAAAVAFVVGMPLAFRQAADAGPPRFEWAAAVVLAGYFVVPPLCLVGVVRHLGGAEEVLPLRRRLLAGLRAALVVVPVGFVAMLPPAGHGGWPERVQQCRRNGGDVGLLAWSEWTDALNEGVPAGWRASQAELLDGDPAAAEAPDALRCPSVDIDADLATSDPATWTAWAVLTGPDTLRPPDEGPLPLRRCLDGTANTLLFVEASGRQIPWRSAEEIDTAALPPGVNRPGRRAGFSDGWLSSYHPNGGAYAVTADGSVRRVDESIDADILRRLANPNDGRTVDW